MNEQIHQMLIKSAEESVKEAKQYDNYYKKWQLAIITNKEKSGQNLPTGTIVIAKLCRSLKGVHAIVHDPQLHIDLHITNVDCIGWLT